MQNDPDDNDDDGSGRPFTATVVAGPAVTAGVDLGVGRSVIGRAVTCAVVVPDAAVEAHHVALDLTADGSASIRQLTGRRPVLVDGDPVDGTTIAHAGVLLTMGNSLVRLDRRPPARAAMAVGAVPDDSGRRLVLRPPRAPRIAPDATVSVPAPAASPPTPPGTAIVGGLVAAVAALGLAAVVGQPMFAVFGAMGAVVSIATWGVQRVGWARTAKRARAATVASERELESAIEAAGRRLRTHHVESVMTAADALGLVGTDAQWMRRTEHGDAFEVSLGIGEVERSIDIVAAGSSSLADTNHAAARELARRYGRLNAVAYDVRLDAHDPEVVAITGEHAMALANALVAQLAVHTGPADWCLVAAVDHPEAYGWVHRLPHAGIAGLPGLVGSDDRAALVDLLDQAALTDRRLVLLTDRPDLLAERSSVLRTFLGTGRRATVIAVCADGDAVPSVATAVVEVGCTGAGRWIPRPPAGSDESPWPSARIHIAGLDGSVLGDLARAMRADADPEQAGQSLRTLPLDVALCDLPGMPGDVDDVLAQWARASFDHRVAAPIGVDRDGAVVVDLAADGPHALVAGTTGSGKSELLRTLVVALAAVCPPEHLQFVLVDYKGGSAFDACVDLPHVAGVVTDLDGGLAERAITGLQAELRRRERVLRDHGNMDLDAHREQHGVAALARLVVVVDEFAVLASEHPTFMSSLVDIARRGRSLGVHLVLATQRPAGVVDDAIRANADLRIALRLRDASDAIDVVDDPAPARIPRRHHGRAIMRAGGGDVVELQVARSSGGDGLRSLIEQIRSADERRGGTRLAPPWLPPLPTELADLDGGGVGLVDDPAAQSQSPLRWSPGDGNLALVGARRTGTTSTLLTLSASLLDRDVDLVVFDARGDERLTQLEQRAECAGVVRAADRERIDRALRRLGAELERRLSDSRAERRAPMVVLIDGFVGLRVALSDRAGEELLALLDRVVAEGPGVGIVTVAVVEPHGAASSLGRFTERWVFHIDDVSHAAALGVAPSDLAPQIAGRLVIASTGRAAQVLAPRPIGADGSRAIGSRSIGRLPAQIEPTTLPRSALGLEHVSLEPFHVTIAGGEHVLVVGTPRSGRTTVLERLRDGWLSARPDGAVWSADGVAELAAVLAGGDRAPHLLAIDDADHIDDEAGHLARLIALGHRGLNIVAAVRPDLARGRFGHWTSALARHRTGIVMTAASADADLVGVVEALRSPIDPRPGLAWVIHGGRSTLVQVAAGTRESSRDRPLRAKVRSASPGRSAAERDADLGGGQRTTGQGVPAQPHENESPISATTTPACR